MPPVTKNILIINFIVWLAMILMPERVGAMLMHYCALHYVGATDFNAAQLVTYMFMHSTDTLIHILFNMFTLFMFGIVLERVMGSKRFLFFYLSCGVGAALVQEGVWALTLPEMVVKGLAKVNDVSVGAIEQYVAMNPNLMTLNFNVFTTVGASGAIYGVLLAFGMLFPNRPLYLFFIPVPIKAKWMVLGYGVFELLIGMSQANDGVAHFAHLGGMLFGFLIIYYWKKRGEVHGDDYLY